MRFSKLSASLFSALLAVSLVPAPALAEMSGTGVGASGAAGNSQSVDAPAGNANGAGSATDSGNSSHQNATSTGGASGDHGVSTSSEVESAFAYSLRAQDGTWSESLPFASSDTSLDDAADASLKQAPSGGIYGIKLAGAPVELRVCAQDGSWTSWSQEAAATSPITALEARITASAPAGTQIWYRAHVTGQGWLAWVCGAPADSDDATVSATKAGADASRGALDAVQFVLVDTNEKAPGNDETGEAYLAALTASTNSGAVGAARPGVGDSKSGEQQPQTTASISYQVHGQSYGTQKSVKDGQLAGSTGRGKRLEGFRAQLSLTGVSGGIEYLAHVQTFGWGKAWTEGGAGNENWVGTMGRSKRMEALRIRLTGDVAKYYDVYYRAHVQTFGWQPWVKNGAIAGTVGRKKRVEAIEVVLVKKGDPVPQDSSKASYTFENAGKAASTTPRVEYRSHVQRTGWQGWVRNDAGSTKLVESGTEGKGLRLEAVQLRLRGIDGGIRYKAHVQRDGWMQDWASDGTSAGTTGRGLRLEAIQIELTGNAAKTYDIYYRVHAQTYGWLGWAKNGESAGTSGISRRLEAFEVVLVPKDSKAPGSTAQHFVDGSKLGKIGYQNPAGWPQVSRFRVWVPQGHGAFSYASPSRIKVDATRSQCVEAMIARAYDYLGDPWVNKYSTAPHTIGVDCSGFVMQCLYATGMSLQNAKGGPYNPYTHRYYAWQEYNSMNWWNNQTFKRVPISQRRRGDLVFYRGHIGIYLGNDRIIDSNGSVRVRPLRGSGLYSRLLGFERPFQ